MKSAILLLAALVSTVQTVGWVECCCVLICKHHNDPCKDECKDKEQAAAHDCCEKPGPQPSGHEHGKRCSHVEPSSEILTQTADLPNAAAPADLDLPVVQLLLVRIPVDAESCPESARGSPPLLHLLYSHLLI